MRPRNYEDSTFDPEDDNGGIEEELGYLGLHLWTEDDFEADLPDDG